jgi:hypothetical protein
MEVNAINNNLVAFYSTFQTKYILYFFKASAKVNRFQSKLTFKKFAIYYSFSVRKNFSILNFSQVDCVIPEIRLTGTWQTKFIIFENKKSNEMIIYEICLLFNL